MQWQVGTTWVRDARVRQDAAVVSSAAAEESARQAQLVSDFREQLAKGEAEKDKVMQKLQAVRSGYTCSTFLHSARCLGRILLSCQVDAAYKWRVTPRVPILCRQRQRWQPHRTRPRSTTQP